MCRSTTSTGSTPTFQRRRFGCPKARGSIAWPTTTIRRRTSTTPIQCRQYVGAIKLGKKLRRKVRQDSLQSERATCICWYEWLARSSMPERRKQALAMRDGANHIRSIAPREEMRCLHDALTRVCRHLDELSSHWSLLSVGESITIRWPDLAVLAQHSGLQNSDLAAAKLAVAH